MSLLTHDTRGFQTNEISIQNYTMSVDKGTLFVNESFVVSTRRSGLGDYCNGRKRLIVEQ